MKKTTPKKAAPTKARFPQTDREMIHQPECWPRHPFLPMKNSRRSFHEERAFGLMVAYQDKTRWPGEKIAPVILHVNLYDLPDLGYLKRLIAASEKTEYASLDMLLADGWVID
jgi:hypothetical protein